LPDNVTTRKLTNGFVKVDPNEDDLTRQRLERWHGMKILRKVTTHSLHEGLT
ncbi:hypothetical protein NPIL_9581, partial [Nephila pilipes]